MKIIERKSGLEGIANFIGEVDGKKTYEIVLNGQDPKQLAESTFKRNFKVAKEDVNNLNLDTNGGNEEMEKINNIEQVEIINEEVSADIEETPVEVEEIVIEDNNDETLVERTIKDSEKELEVVLTEEQALEVEQAVEDLSSVIAALPTMKVTIEKNSRSTKVELYPTKMQLVLGYENSLMDYIVKDLKNKISENIELEYINQQKRSNPAAFKARGVQVTDKEGKIEYFKCRNDAMIWITTKFENGELDKKPTYYQVKKALEAGGGEYLGYNWEECDPSEAVTVQ